MIKINEKIEACLMLGSYLDTLGFKNGNWEFNYNQVINDINLVKSIWLDIIHEYYILGGDNISIKNWTSSDDTILMIANCKAVLQGGGKQNYIDNYLAIFNILTDDRAPGKQTIKSLTLLKKIMTKDINFDIRNISIQKTAGGNGCSIRSAAIGIKWYNNEDKIIEESIISGILTHPWPLGFLGGLVMALFTSYAINNIDPLIWIDKLLVLYKLQKIQNYIKSLKLKKKVGKNIKFFFSFWFKYQEERMIKINIKTKSRIFVFAEDRIKDLLNYSPLYIGLKDKNMFNWSSLGRTGIDSLIIAYDSLLLSKIDNLYNWNNLVFFSTLNIGDNDSIGIIAGCWFGALLGFQNINKEKMKELEFYSDLVDLSDKLNKSF